MPQQDEVYNLPDEEILDALRREVESVQRPRPAPGMASGVRPLPAGIAAVPSRAAVRGTRAPLAAALSLLLCGAGQAYNRQFKLGSMMFLMASFALIAHWSVVRSWASLGEAGAELGIEGRHVLVSIASLGALLLLVVLGSVHQAYRRAEREAGGFEGFAHPIVSAIASLAVPGLGQILNGQIGKAIVFLFWALAGGFLTAELIYSPALAILGVRDLAGFLTEPVTAAAGGFLAVSLVLWVLSAYDALLVASIRRRGI